MMAAPQAEPARIRESAAGLPAISMAPVGMTGYSL
jgi:hypothetical protein